MTSKFFESSSGNPISQKGDTTKWMIEWLVGRRGLQFNKTHMLRITSIRVYLDSFVHKKQIGIYPRGC